MDPNLFHLDWDRTFEVLAAVVILSIFVERALALLFENRKFLRATSGRPVKEIIAFIVCAAVCIYWKFDAVSMVVLRSQTTHWGELITAGVIAGGAKGSIKLFRDVLDFKSTAYREKELLDRTMAVAASVPGSSTVVGVTTKQNP
jgi:hypothetical protein